MVKNIFLIFSFFFILFSCQKNDPNNSEILNLGISLEVLIQKGVPVEKLYHAGATIKELVDANAPLDELIKIKGVKLRDIIIAEDSDDLVVALYRNGFVTISDLVNAGFGIEPLIRAGYSSEIEKLNLIGFLFDVSGKQYKWVKIGNQIWMAEDLKVSKYTDGSSMKLLNETVYLQDFQYAEKVYYFRNFYYDLYGKIYPINEDGYYYTWSAAMNGLISSNDSIIIQGACPNGWHIPSKAEFDTLINFVTLNNYRNSLGASLRSENCWSSNSVSGYDYFGFSALPKGYYYSGIWGDLGNEAIFWTSNSSQDPSNGNDVYHAEFFEIQSNGLGINDGNKVEGRCVRCIKNK
jgi:uncharacterized protein (TIGR02145 family)